MKKIAIAVLTACVLFSIFPQMMAAAWEIKIDVAKDTSATKIVYYIDMGEKYAYAVPEGAIVKWKCDYPFTLLFQGDSPFEADDVEDTPKSKVKKLKGEVETNHIYKYTVSVTFGDGGPLILDPVIIIIPPRK